MCYVGRAGGTLPGLMRQRNSAARDSSFMKVSCSPIIWSCQFHSINSLKSVVLFPFLHPSSSFKSVHHSPEFTIYPPFPRAFGIIPWTGDTTSSPAAYIKGRPLSLVTTVLQINLIHVPHGISYHPFSILWSWKPSA